MRICDVHCGNQHLHLQAICKSGFDMIFGIPNIKAMPRELFSQ
jgi:hypothetical protein